MSVIESGSNGPVTWVYYFGEGDTEDKGLLGGKGCGLGVMTKIGLPVPPGFTITTRACIYFSKNKKHPEGLRDQVKEKMVRLVKETGKSFGGVEDGKDLLLLSVRSGAKISMPGMMDTVLNLGLNDQAVLDFAKMTQNERFAWDSYRRFVSMFGDVVMGVEHHKFESEITKMKEKLGVKDDTELTAENLKELVVLFKNVIKEKCGVLFPQDPWEQLWMAIDAVFSSWDNPRAITYRELNGLSHSMGTAVNVQSMVFGNMGDNSGTGVAFTRSPVLGTNERYGEFLVNAQGEDVVAGVRTPEKIADMKKRWPKNYEELMDAFDKLEQHYREMQDCEFTVENGKLYMLQTRKGKRTAAAAVKIAVDMYKEGLMTKEEAILSVDPLAISQLLHKQLNPIEKKKMKVLAKGLPASPGAGVGQVVFTAAKAVEAKNEGKQVVLVRLETSPDDISGMDSSEGILTARGGMTSHAAVVARGMGKCCVAGCSDITFPEDKSDGHSVKECYINDTTIKEMDWITLDGATGEILLGKCPVIDVHIEGDYATIMGWADEIRELNVRTNADKPHDAKKALEFGAFGIGLTRSEHMFFDRITHMREMILAETEEERKLALEKLLPHQIEDFEGLFMEMSGKPVLIRTLDAPMHEFLPQTPEDIKALSEDLGVPEETIMERAQHLKEQNPMLGFRGCRVGIVHNPITEMQARAIFRGAKQAFAKGAQPIPEIEIPLVGKLEEYLPLKELIQKVAKEESIDQTQIPFRIGMMIEVPRAAITADRLAKHCDFMSFGTNDLTQMTCGFSRDDSGTFLGSYVRQGIYERDPFVSIDQDGVGKLMKICVALARAANPTIDIGVCGEHGGEPASVEFCHRIGLTDVSCSPYRVPVARLAAAHAKIKYGPKPETLDIHNIIG